MGQHQSKGELLFQQVSYGNVVGIQSLRRDGVELDVQFFWLIVTELLEIRVSRNFWFGIVVDW